MDVDIIFKIAGIGIIVGVLHTLLKESGKEEYAYMIVTLGIVIAFGVVVKEVAKFFNEIKVLFRL